MQILEFIKQNAEAFTGIPNAGEVIENVVSKMQELGYSALANNTKEPMYVDKAQFDQVTAQSADLTKQVDELKKSVEGIGELTKSNEELQKTNEGLTTKYKSTAINSALKLAAINAKAKNPDDLFKFIDMSKINLKDDESIEGLDDQIKSLTQSKGYLFGDTVPAGNGFNPAGGGGNSQKDPEKMSMTEYSQWYDERNKK